MSDRGACLILVFIALEPEFLLNENQTEINYFIFCLFMN